MTDKQDRTHKADNEQTKRILIVDDDPNVATVLAESLTRPGGEYVVETANGGEAALQKVKDKKYTLIITDYMMPDMDGLNLAQSVRKLSPDTRVVLMTAYGSSDLRNAVKTREIDGYIDKPFTISEIRSIVEKAIRSQ